MKKTILFLMAIAITMPFVVSSDPTGSWSLASLSPGAAAQFKPVNGAQDTGVLKTVRCSGVTVSMYGTTLTGTVEQCPIDGEGKGLTYCKQVSGTAISASGTHSMQIIPAPEGINVAISAATEATGTLVRVVCND